MSVIKECFNPDDIENIYRDKPDKIMVAIKDNDKYLRNCCVLQNDFFDYKKFKTLKPWEVDCHSHGVYVFFNHAWKNDNVEYVFACNYENFNDEFKEKYDRDATEDDWKLFKEKFNELKTDRICEFFHTDITEIIDEEYTKEFKCEGCDTTVEPDGHEVSCIQCSKNHGCSECNGSWTARERNFCEDCNTGYGYDMYSCYHCGEDNEETDDTIEAMDGMFCSEKCLDKYIAENRS